MKQLCAVILCLSVIALFCGCQSNKSRVAEGAVIGGIVGAGAGGIIGHQGHHGAEGAGIGAAAGALLGAIVGAQVEKPPASSTGNAQPAGQAAANPNQMSTQQIVDLTKQGVNEAVIIDKIRLSNSVFALSASDVESLKQQGVSAKVIEAMQTR